MEKLQITSLHPRFCFLLLPERDARDVTRLQHGKLQILQEPLEDVRRASYLLPAGPARTSSEELLLTLLQLGIKVPLLVRERASVDPSDKHLKY